MATNYDINYNDERFTKVESDKKAALSEIEKTYGGMIDSSDAYYQSQIDASKQWADKQTQLQNQQTDFAIEKIEQQKDQAKKDYTKEQSGAFVDWRKQSNEYGANAEQMAASGLINTGFSESSQVSMYNTYQNRVSAARESYNRAVLNFNNSITEARMQNNSILAEIAYESLQKQLELSLQGFQYKNQLLLEMANKKTEAENTYYARYQDVLAQINHENALAEEVRQYNATLAEQKRQHDASIAQHPAALALQREQFEYQKSKDASSGGGGGSSEISKNKTTKKTAISSGKKAQVDKLVTEKNGSPDALNYLNALIKSGATKDKVANEISLALRNGAITKAEATALRNAFTPRGVQY